MSNLRDLVAAWEAQGARCSQAFDTALGGINRELDAVGGYVTTSPDKDGYCQDYTRQADTFGGGVTKVGKDACHPHEGKVTPYLTEVGDRCFALEQAWRKEAMAYTVASEAIQQYVREHGGGDDLWRVAVALVKSERSEREAIVRWLESMSGPLVNRIVSSIERGDHLLGRPRSVRPTGSLRCSRGAIPSTDQICARWRAHRDPSGPCYPSGEKRCTP